jgi:hypothetical protein
MKAARVLRFGPPSVITYDDLSKRITIIASKMITWQELRERLQNV